MPDTQTARRPRATTPDAVLVAAVDLAREAADDAAADGSVGEPLGHEVDGDRTLTHFFASTAPGYRGWHWAVTLARVPRSRTATVSEVHLLPGDDSIVSPTWVPWADRIAPGDLAPGMVLPKRVDDPRLEEGFEATGDDDVDQMAFWEPGSRPAARALARGSRGRRAALVRGPPRPARPARRGGARALQQAAAGSCRWPVRCGRRSACAPASGRRPTVRS
ncbi:hypothetical protein GCM10025868_16360 [Angustibacter aerolatus]|uniref:DUF3027 domain-containing protein n=1 Tax=Angustibacter aerolatus TaxID=1162965 RepID=A0ABQ6JFP8_9ACTN|nr:DUF3027 domain-containing protein [Angustibacter aerolatus]GMA86386.1 hypothetical protein GCM10025868_16360 [Angustibacter aerolatus]